MTPLIKGGRGSFIPEHRVSGHRLLYSPYQPILSCRYEDEINKRTNAENEFVTIKKVSKSCGVGGAHL